jgi:hypothetical protein
MKRLATSKDMLFEQKLAQDFEALDDAERRNENPMSDEMLPEEAMEAAQDPTVDSSPDDWPAIQSDLRAGVYGDWQSIRSMIAEQFAEEAPGQGISSSDFNHIAYGMVRSGELVPVGGFEVPESEGYLRNSLGEQL